MEKLVKEAKTIEEALEKINEENNLTSSDYIYTKEKVKGKLFKGESVKATVYKKEDIYTEIKKYLKEICNGLNLEVTFEVLTKEGRTTIKMHSENSSILIGKNGQTIKSLEILAKQKVFIDTGINFKVTLDVENYRDKKESRLIRLAKTTAKEVLKTKIPVHLENMNSFERRIMHNALTEFKGIKTHSEGVEPNRHLVIEAE